MTTYLIVGANRGLGLEFVKQLLEDKTVSHVYATARTPSQAKDLNKLVTSSQGRATVIELEMTDESSVKKAASELAKQTNSIDRIIVNAGIARTSKLMELTASDFKELFDVNVLGPLLVGQSFVPFLLKSKAEKRELVFMSSFLGSIGTLEEVGGRVRKAYQLDYNPTGGYSVSKTALDMLGRQFALELEPQGISVILISAGMVYTDMNAGVSAPVLISAEESISHMLKALEGTKLGDGKKGILNHDGTFGPW